MHEAADGGGGGGGTDAAAPTPRRPVAWPRLENVLLLAALLFTLGAKLIIIWQQMPGQLVTGVWLPGGDGRVLLNP